jgi:hypothetical protein
MPHRGHVIRATTRQLIRSWKRLKCWLWHRQTWKVMDLPHGRVQVYEFGCRRCSCVWYVPAMSPGAARITRTRA